FPLGERLPHKTELEMLQIAQAAVNEPGRGAGRAGGDVGLVEQQDGETAERRLARDRGAVDAATDDDHVVTRIAHRVRIGSRLDAGRVRAQGRTCPLPRTTYL